MQTSPAFQPAAAAPARAGAAPQRRVIDAPTRMFHWLFALSFVGAYLTADGERWRALHVTLGYTLAGLLAFRVLYGLLGPRQAGLGLLLRKLGSAPAWLRSAAQALRQGTAHGINWRQGQNLLMALAVLALLVLVVPLTLSGYGTYNDWGDFLGGDWLEDVHEFFGNAFLAVVLAHLGADRRPEPAAAQEPGAADADRPHRRRRARPGQAQPRLAGRPAAGRRAGLRRLAVAAVATRADAGPGHDQQGSDRHHDDDD